MHGYDNFLFDLYGTLVDIHTDEAKQSLWRHLAQWYRCHGAMYTPLELHHRYHSLVRSEKKAVALAHPQYRVCDIKIEHVFSALYARKGVRASVGTVMETALFFRTVSRSYIRPYPHIRPMLRELHAQGKKCILLSNAQSAFTMPELRMLGLDSLLDGIVISSDHECAKPDPHFFQIALQRFELQPGRTIMVGNDAGSDIAGANAAGIDSVYIHTETSPALSGQPKSTYAILNGDTKKLRRLLTRL